MPIEMMLDPWFLISIWFAFWLICGAICGAIACSKCRNEFGWFICGCFFGPVGILLAALMPSKQTQKGS